MTSLIKRRNDYYKMIWEYERRRRNLRIKFGLHPEWPTTAPIEYKVVADVYTKKIGTWRRQMRKLDRIRDEIVFLEKSVKLFLDTKITGYGGYTKDKTLVRGKRFYYKFGLEAGYEGKDLKEHIKDKAENRPAKSRSTLNQKLLTDPKEKELWERFKRFHQRRLEAEQNRNIPIALTT